MLYEPGHVAVAGHGMGAGHTAGQEVGKEEAGCGSRLEEVGGRSSLEEVGGRSRLEEVGRDHEV